MLSMVAGLRSESVSMSVKVDSLQAQLNEFIGKVDTLQTSFDSQATKLASLEAQSSYLRYQLALQDLNARYQLETNMVNHFSRMNLKKLRNVRNSDAHLYDEADDAGVIGYKTKKAIEMLENMSPTTAASFTDKFGPSFVAAVVKHFKVFVDALPTTTDNEEIELANEWWVV